MNIRILFRTLAERRQLAHAYLFAGNDEEQKNQLVADLIAALNIQPADQTILEPAPQNEISIAQIRQLTAFLSLTAWNSPCKIALMRAAHAMNQEAQSAFLKLLEEPKGDTVFFLLTQYPDMLLYTIRSRTQEFRFYSFAPSKVSERELAEFQKLQKADIVARFGLAKELADAPEQTAQTLQHWLVSARHLMREAARTNSQTALPLAKAISVIQETLTLLRTTNINPRLALERLLLHL